MKDRNISRALERIRAVQEKRHTFLDLSGLWLTEIPVDISHMNYLRDIDLSYNRLSEFPEALAKLDCL
ncbi:MAG: hypothetical protein AAFP76_17695, partial [Bacteroidota bacterium]